MHTPSIGLPSSTRSFVPALLLLALCACDASDGDGSPDATADAGEADNRFSGFDASVRIPQENPSPVLPPGYDGPTADSPIVMCEETVSSGEEPLIDDFEGDGMSLVQAEGRDGGWYGYDDGTGGVHSWERLPEDEEGGRGGVMRISGGAFADWGSGVGFALSFADQFCSYDASAYVGLRFLARGSGQARVALQNPEVRPEFMGGTCPDDASCFDGHGKDFTFTDEWAYYVLYFDELEQAGWGLQVGDFKPESLYLVEWQLPGGGDYDIWLDEVRFIRAEERGQPLPPLVSGDAGTPLRDAAADSGSVDSGTGMMDSGVLMTDSAAPADAALEASAPDAADSQPVADAANSGADAAWVADGGDAAQ